MTRLTYLSLLPPERDLRRHDPLALGDECALGAQTVPPTAIPLVALIILIIITYMYKCTACGPYHFNNNYIYV